MLWFRFWKGWHIQFKIQYMLKYVNDLFTYSPNDWENIFSDSLQDLNHWHLLVYILRLYVLVIEFPLEMSQLFIKSALDYAGVNANAFAPVVPQNDASQVNTGCQFKPKQKRKIMESS